MEIERRPLEVSNLESSTCNADSCNLAICNLKMSLFPNSRQSCLSQFRIERRQFGPFKRTPSRHQTGQRCPPVRYGCA
jgi:hypothetical protein